MGSYETSGGAPGGSGTTTEVAKEQAGNVGQSAAGAVADVAQTTKEQGREVVAEAGRQARDLAHEARTQVREQAVTQRDRAVSGLRALGDELEQMARGGQQSGTASEIARQAAGRTREIARFLESREPGELLEEVRAYARRRPGTFLVGAAIAGVLAGRLTKAVRADSPDSADTTARGYPDHSVADYWRGAAYPNGGFRDAPTTPVRTDTGYGSAVPAAPAAEGYVEPAHGSAPSHGTAGNGDPAYVDPGYAQPAYGTKPGYGTEPGYGTQAAAGTEPGYGTQAAAGTGPGYGSEPGHGTEPRYGTEPAAGAEPASGREPGYGTEPAAGTEPTYGTEPVYGSQPGYGVDPATGYGTDPAYGNAPAYPPPAPGTPEYEAERERERASRGWTQ